ncbi:MAG TPA: AMP-binding protein [Steroidobacteraceae bacterium]|nr:AMP-binding protein [Steroidobacteraceae bacterium]
MPAWPLFVHERPESIVAYRDGAAIDARRFLRDVRVLARRLPCGTHVLNLCADRYRFAVAFAASLLSGKCSLLPPAHTPEVIRHLQLFAPDAFCLTDDADSAVELPLLFYRDGDADDADDAAADAAPWSVPQIGAAQLAAYVFTSGSTGAPLPHRKTWGRLVQCVRLEAARLAPLARGGSAILGTVPPQHMYGFESTVLLPLQSGGALCARRPFFPADIAAALQELPRARMLITTPVHLRSLIAAEMALPGLDLIVSATAMLPANLAREVERRYAAPLLEIYGSTETGQIAARRTAFEDQWRLWDGVRLEWVGERCWAQGGHIEQPTAIADILELKSEDRFVLHGRTADLVNIAGKRSSLAHLNHHLNAIPGVLDGAFFVREDAHASLAGVTRLAALVVAPTLELATILRQLRQRIDPVFLPRPLLRVEALPRNETGKLPQHTLRTLVAQAAARAPHLFA